MDENTMMPDADTPATDDTMTTDETPTEEETPAMDVPEEEIEAPEEETPAL